MWLSLFSEHFLPHMLLHYHLKSSCLDLEFPACSHNNYKVPLLIHGLCYLFPYPNRKIRLHKLQQYEWWQIFYLLKNLDVFHQRIHFHHLPLFHSSKPLLMSYYQIILWLCKFHLPDLVLKAVRSKLLLSNFPMLHRMEMLNMNRDHNLHNNTNLHF